MVWMVHPVRTAATGDCCGATGVRAVTVLPARRVATVAMVGSSVAVVPVGQAVSVELLAETAATLGCTATAAPAATAQRGRRVPPESIRQPTAPPPPAAATARTTAGLGNNRLWTCPAACSAKTVGRVPAAVRGKPAEAAEPVATARQRRQVERSASAASVATAVLVAAVPRGAMAATAVTEMPRTGEDSAALAATGVPVAPAPTVARAETVA